MALIIKDLLKTLSSVKAIFILSTIFFSMGYIADGMSYFMAHNTLYLTGNIVTLILIWVVFLLYKFRILELNAALLAHVAVVTMNIYLGIIFEIALGVDMSVIHVVECMCICMVPAILSGMVNRWVPLAVTLGAIVLYIVAGITSDNKEGMLSYTPAFAIVIVGLGYTFSFLLEVTRKMERKNLQVEAEQENIFKMFDFTPKQWEMIKNGRMSCERLNELLKKNDKKVQEEMIHRMKELIQTNEQIKNAIRKHHDNLTFGEMELACMVAKGMTVTKISQLRKIKIPTITAQRSRLRKKLGLTEEQNLNEYLTSLAKGEI